MLALCNHVSGYCPELFIIGDTLHALMGLPAPHPQLAFSVLPLAEVSRVVQEY